MDKVCCRCKTVKLIAEFGRNKRCKDGLQKCCKSCQKEKDKLHYEKGSRRKDYLRKATQNKRNEHREFLFKYLSEHPCIDCGESDPIVLEFDHQHSKTMPVAKMVSSACSLNRLQNEIEKCEVRCANCHRRKTAKQFNWYKYATVSDK